MLGGLIMWPLTIVSVVLAFVFLVVCLASGLYWLTELVEEHIMFTKHILRNAIYINLALHVLIMLDDMPFWPSFLGLLAHGLYYQLVQTFPVFDFKSPVFIGSGIAVLLNHAVWFRYFTITYHGFGDVVSVFLLLVWLVPFTFFISLTANDNVLPTSMPSASAGGDASTPTGMQPGAGFSTGKRVNVIRSVIDWFRGGGPGLPSHMR